MVWSIQPLPFVIIGDPSGDRIVIGPGAYLPPPLDTYLIEGIVWVSGNTMSYRGIRDDAGTIITEDGYVSSGGVIVPQVKFLEVTPTQASYEFIGGVDNRFSYNSATVSFLEDCYVRFRPLTTVDQTIEFNGPPASGIIHTKTLQGSGGGGVTNDRYDGWLIDYNTTDRFADGKPLGKGILDAVRKTDGATKYGPATAEALITDASVTGNLINGRVYRVTLSCDITSSTAGDTARIDIHDTNLAGTDLNFDQTYVPGAAFQMKCDVSYDWIATATAARTFVGTARRAAGAGNVSVVARANHPLQMSIEDVTDSTILRT